MTNFIYPISNAIGYIFMPLRSALSKREEFEMLLLEFGWDVDISEVNWTTLSSSFSLINELDNLETGFDELNYGINLDSLEAALNVIELIKDIFNGIKDLNQISVGGYPLNNSAFWEDILELLPDYLIIDYVKKHQPIPYALLVITGIFNTERVDVTGSKIAFNKRSIDWNQFVNFLKSPKSHFQNLYNFGSGLKINHNKLFGNLESILLAFEVPVSISSPRLPLHYLLLQPTDIISEKINEIEIPILSEISPVDKTFYKTGLVILPIPDNSGIYSGIAIAPILQGEANETVWLFRDIALNLKGAFDAEESVIIKILPEAVTIENTIASSQFSGSIELSGLPEEPFVLIGDPHGSRLEIDAFSVVLGVRGTVNDPEIYFVLGTGDIAGGDERPKIRAIFESGDGDGFIKKILKKVPVTLEFAGNFIWSSRTGVTFEGAGGFSFSKAINKKIGFLEIKTIYFELIGKDTGAFINIGVGISATIGPLFLYVENVGVSIKLIPLQKEEPSGMLGRLDLDFGFKFPNAIALSINAQKFSGGGYLYIGDHRYAGVVNLNFSGSINFTAIVIINTKLPGGKEGFALLLIIMVDGFTPIQLGMGFTLNGIGGLLALHRTMKLEVLRDGVKTGMNDRLMFPQNPLENINLILSDLEAAFPIEEGRFVFGPMFILGWGGAKALLTVKVGLFIEVPSPIRIAILGVLNCILPTEGANTEVLVLVVNFTGTFDQEKKFITFDASLTGSRLLNFVLDGDMAFRLKYGENPNFLISVGGFHPGFKPPPLALPLLKRISLTLLDEENGKVRFETYFAITSNTVQLGARVDAVFKAGEFDAIGYLGFDALFQFSPFYVMFDTYAGFALLKGGKEKASVNVHLHVDGPTPWHVSGTATAKILGIEFSFDFARTFGEERHEIQPNINVLELIKPELENVDNWKAVLPAGQQELVQIRILTVTDGLVVNPGGSFIINQHVAPLKTILQRYGNQGVEGPNWFEIREITIGGSAQTLIDEEDFFAPAQYKTLSETAKVSGPSFTKFDSGVRIAGSEETKTGPFVNREIIYEQIVIDGPDRTQPQYKHISNLHFEVLSQDSAIGRSTLAKSNQSKLTVIDRRVPLKDEKFHIVRTHDLTVYAALPAFSQSKANDQLEAIIEAHPELEDELIIVPAYNTLTVTKPVIINHTETQ